MRLTWTGARAPVLRNTPFLCSGQTGGWEEKGRNDEEQWLGRCNGVRKRWVLGNDETYEVVRWCASWGTAGTNFPAGLVGRRGGGDVGNVEAVHDLG